MANLLPLNIRLDRHNYSYWRSLILPSVRARGLEETLLGTTPRPNSFLADQELAMYILGGVGHEYETMVVLLAARVDALTLQEVQYMLQNEEMLSPFNELGLQLPSCPILWDRVLAHELDIRHVSVAHQIADSLTKLLPQPQYDMFRDKLTLRELSVT
uniref:Retrotransposon Copia-like N-terminal domain-containing protein n=1 Tax=Cannabis sativa TaxID=3483 RepID=A0A803QME0_CANSA